MTLYSPAQSLDQPRVGDSGRRFDIVTIGLHWATVTLIAGLFGSAWLLLASDRERILARHRCGDANSLLREFILGSMAGSPGRYPYMAGLGPNRVGSGELAAQA